jgi:hypothetical protein
MARTSTQQFLELDKIKEGVIVLKDKSLRGVVMVSSLNFALKSEEDQQIIISQFQNFLNSLDFSLEIVMQSRKLNITGYLDKLKELGTREKNELLKLQIEEYEKFIGDLISEGAIMSKNFFVITPFTFAELPKTTDDGNKKGLSLDEERFQRARSQLWQRMEFVALGLRRCGLECVPLNTPELIELFWSLYHPEEGEVGYYPEIPPELSD